MAGAGKSRDRRTRFIKESPSQGMILSLHWAEKIRKKKKGEERNGASSSELTAMG